MDEVKGFRSIWAKIAFTTMGAGALLWSAIFNPIVLRPRFWSVTVIVHLVVFHAVVIGVGLGLLSLRKWAALFASAVTLWLAVDGARNLWPDAKWGIVSILTLRPSRL